MTTLEERIAAAQVDTAELRARARVDDALWAAVSANITNGEGQLETIADFGFCHPADIDARLHSLRSSLERARVGLLYDLCRGVCGLPLAMITTGDADVVQDDENLVPENSAKRRKVSHYLDPVMDGSFVMMDAADYDRYVTELQTRFGEIDDDNVPTREQLSGLKSRVDAGEVPYVDLSVFTANQRERLKSVRMSVWGLDEDGEAKRRVVSRCLPYLEWTVNFRVYSLGMIMLGCGKHADFLKYSDMIGKLYRTYPQYWPQVLAADENMRVGRLSRYKQTSNNWGDAYVKAATDSAYWLEKVDRVVFQLANAGAGAPSKESVAKLKGESRSREICFGYQNGRCEASPTQFAQNEADPVKDERPVSRLTTAANSAVTDCLGGLRNPHLSTRYLPHGIIKFKKLREYFERILEGRPQVVDAILSAEDPLADSVVRCAVEEGRMAILRVAGGCASDLLPTHECSPVRGRLLQLLVSYSGDWDSDVPRWYTDGCPVGLEVPIPVKGVFPTEATGLEPDSDCSLSFIDGSSDLSGYSNYESVEDNPDAVISLLREEESKGFCTFYESLSDVQKAVDGKPLVPH
ncbi:hypothetical protein FOZ60_016501 [Perkinsus olseni]|uniref:Uncharacterized protein n=1 Tax=Perkinsus olseni TaxID=32597 RepID=A0A7J6N6K0_PEROL|nr:hypothetical protein FOZ60_016501 [Perkinsus olseni]